MENSQDKKNKFWRNALTVGLFCVGYVTTGFLGYAIHDTIVPAKKPQKKHEKSIKTQHQKNLEDILDATQRLINISTYEFEYHDIYGNKKTEEKDLYFIGSAVGVYKNLNERALFFLSCDHVTASPKEIFRFGIKDKIVNGFYSGTIKEGDSERKFYCTEPINLTGFGVGKLKRQKLGLFKYADRDINGKVTYVSVDEVTELADTGRQAAGKGFIYNDDITLLKVNENVNLDNYKIWKGDWGSDDNVDPGNKIYAVGYPLNLSKQITQGIISSKGDPLRDDDDNFYFTSAQLNPGNSGGGVWRVKHVEVKESGKKKIKEKLEFIGLGRLKYRADGISGVVRIDNIKEFLRKQGYSYIYRKR